MKSSTVSDKTFLTKAMVKTFLFILMFSLSVNASPEKATMSGLSSGAFMTSQFQMAYPELVTGVGIVAGGIPACALGNAFIATEICLKNPTSLVASYYLFKLDLERNMGLIGDKEPISDHKVYIFSSPKDTVVNYPMGEKLKDFYANLVKPENFKMVDSVLSEHAMPTDSAGASCMVKDVPFINNCDYDAAGEMFKHFYGKLKPKVKAKASNFKRFNQRNYTNSNFVADEGYEYIPSKCKDKRFNCRVHIALHGCMQDYENGNDHFASMSGYNEWAESNNIVVVYPSTRVTTFNPNGCWDWWGYTGQNYRYRGSIQMEFLKKILLNYTRSS